MSNKDIATKKSIETSNKCFRCKCFHPYFTRGVKEFNKTKHGWCSKILNHVETQFTCDNFQKKPKSKKEKYFIKVCLNKLLSEITELHKVIKSQSEEDDEV